MPLRKKLYGFGMDFQKFPLGILGLTEIKIDKKVHFSRKTDKKVHHEIPAKQILKNQQNQALHLLLFTENNQQKLLINRYELISN